MRRASILAIALLVIGCSSHLVAPSPDPLAVPQVFQGHGGSQWVVNRDKYQSSIENLVSDGQKTMWHTSEGCALGTTNMRLKYAFFQTAFCPIYLALGSDHNIWYTETESQNSPSRVAKITPAGQSTVYNAEPKQTQIDAITPGPDGALWLAVENHVGRMTTDGNYSTFPMPTGDFATTIISGPGGNLWSLDTYHGTNTLAKITPQGQMTVYPSLGATSMTLGPDGALWLTDAYSILRVTTSGTETQYSTGSLRVSSIITRSDGQLWMLTGAGIISFNIHTLTLGPYIPGPPNFSPTHTMAWAPDGNLWTGGSRGIMVYLLQEMTATPSSLIVAVGKTAPLALTETRYHGKFIVDSSNPAVATIVQNSRGNFTVTGVSQGNAAFTFYDNDRNFVRVFVTVT